MFLSVRLGTIRTQSTSKVPSLLLKSSKTAIFSLKTISLGALTAEFHKGTTLSPHLSGNTRLKRELHTRQKVKNKRLSEQDEIPDLPTGTYSESHKQNPYFCSCSQLNTCSSKSDLKY